MRATANLDFFPRCESVPQISVNYIFEELGHRSVDGLGLSLRFWGSSPAPAIGPLAPVGGRRCHTQGAASHR